MLCCVSFVKSHDIEWTQLVGVGCVERLPQTWISSGLLATYSRKSSVMICRTAKVA